jgi:hypothetical protein
MSLAFRTARIFWLKRTVKWSAVRPAPAPAGDFRQLADHGFCQRENKLLTGITLHRITSAKTPRPHYVSVRGAARHRDSAATPHTAER